MPKQPMWENQTDLSSELTPLDEAALKRVAVADGLRIVTPRGVTYENVVEKVRGGYGNQASTTDVWLAGTCFTLSQHTVYLVAAADLRPKNPVRIEPEAAELRDIVADLSQRNRSVHNTKPCAVSPLSVAEALIGFRADTGKSNAAYGGKSPEGWCNEFVSVGRVKRVLSDLADEGVLRHVKSGTYNAASADDRVVSFVYAKAGYVLAADYVDAADAARAEKRAERRRTLLAKARGTIADRHAAEVEAELERLLGEDRA